MDVVNFITSGKLLFSSFFSTHGPWEDDRFSTHSPWEDNFFYTKVISSSTLSLSELEVQWTAFQWTRLSSHRVSTLAELKGWAYASRPCCSTWEMSSPCQVASLRTDWPNSRTGEVVEVVEVVVVFGLRLRFWGVGLDIVRRPCQLVAP